MRKKWILAPMLATALALSSGLANAADCSMELQQEQLPNDQGVVFNILHLVSHCDDDIELQSIKLNRRDECVIQPNKTLRLGDDYAFGLATNPTEALGMALRKNFFGQEFFDVARCGQPVKLEVSTSAGPFEFGGGE